MADSDFNLAYIYRIGVIDRESRRMEFLERLNTQNPENTTRHNKEFSLYSTAYQTLERLSQDPKFLQQALHAALTQQEVYDQFLEGLLREGIITRKASTTGKTEYRITSSWRFTLTKRPQEKIEAIWQGIFSSEP